LEELSAELKEAGRFIEQLRLMNEASPPELGKRIPPKPVEEEHKFTHLDPKGRYKKSLTNLEEGITYLGEWVDDKPDGFGVLTYPDGRRYEGAMLKGLRHGYGKLLRTDGSTYEGDYKDDTWTGRGVARWPSG
jgi:hypothetical protein